MELVLLERMGACSPFQLADSLEVIKGKQTEAYCSEHNLGSISWLEDFWNEETQLNADLLYVRRLGKRSFILISFNFNEFMKV